MAECTNMTLLEDGNRKWWILAAMTFATSMIFIDMTVLPVALPTIQRELNLSELALQWIVNAYLLSLTVLSLAGGKLGDMLGQRKIYNIGLVIFAVASALCAFSYSDAWFVTSRALQGVGGAFIMPAIGAILISVFPPQERGKAMGLNVSISSIFLAIGPFVGGFFTQYLSWRYVFWINLPIAAIGVVLALFFVPKTKGHKEKFDLVGFLTLAVGISLIVVAFMQTSKWGWDSWLTWGLFLLGSLMIAALVVIDRSIEHPFVDFSLFQKKSFVGSISCIFSIGFLIMVTVFWVIFFQDVLGYSPTAAGGIALISNFPLIFVSPLAGHLLDKYGPKLPAMLGFASTLIGLILFVFTVTSDNLGILIPALILFGTGIPLIFNSCFVSSLNQVAPKRRGIASGLLTTIRQMSATVGMAVIGSVFLHRQYSLLGAELQQNPQTAKLDPAAFEGLLASSPGAVQAVQELPKNISIYVEEAVLETYVSAFLDINIFSAVIAAVGLILAYKLLKSGVSHSG